MPWPPRSGAAHLRSRGCADPPKSLKIWADGLVFFIANSVHLFQIISTTERPRRHNSTCHNGPDAGIIFNSFSVAVLMSNLTAGIALLGGAFLSATDAARVGVAGVGIDGVSLKNGGVDNVV